MQETQVTQVQSLGRKEPLENKWQHTPVLLPRRSHGQRSLAGYSPWNWSRVRDDWVLVSVCRPALHPCHIQPSQWTPDVKYFSILILYVDKLRLREVKCFKCHTEVPEQDPQVQAFWPQILSAFPMASLTVWTITLGGPTPCPFSFLMCPQDLEPCLAHSKHLTNICWMNEYNSCHY